MDSATDYLLKEKGSGKWVELSRTKRRVYYISDAGDVVAISAKRIRPIKRGGYNRVNINGKAVSIHRAVARHFIPNPNNKPCINHIDGNKTNNSVDNLEWVTNGENMQHAYDTGLKKRTFKYTDEQVVELIRLVKDGSMSRKQIAKKLGVEYGWINAVLQGKIWSELTGINPKN